MSVQITGLERVQSNLKGLPEKLNKTVMQTLGEYGTKMQRTARQSHRFKSRTGQADRSIETKLLPKELGMMFYIDKQGTSADGKWSGVSYVTFQDQGTGKGYKQSKGADKYSPTAFKTGFGIMHDHFMARSWDTHLKPMIDAIKKRVIATAKAAI